jgi:hypothetical protein
VKGGWNFILSIPGIQFENVGLFWKTGYDVLWRQNMFREILKNCFCVAPMISSVLASNDP